jgi:hypothetical protein
MAKIVAETEVDVKKITTEAGEVKAEGTESGLTADEVVEQVDENATGLFVEREVVRGANKKEYRNYFLKFISRGRSSRVDFVPMDVGGYEVLDFVFGDVSSAELVLEPYTVKDNHTGKITKRGFYYYARNVDENGVYKAQIKPKETSDKDLLVMLLNSKK